jgi:hypothetical protein
MRYLKPGDVEDAIDHSTAHYTDRARQHRDIAVYLNGILTRRYSDRNWRGIGCSMEIVGAVVALAGVMVVISIPDWFAYGLVATVAGFATGVTGWVIGDRHLEQ